ncbi:MAG: bifunctional demethylmenaquinone methyltransferase/2-methoxy-6-polyprenyl-1,4-benzoquinol methylase UbiE [Chitinophagales bacterium]|nr:bifunctional demethylmenaquinone methyltransferase/2-methoxy-6-polyprenyl-1,4-benzoquinol methylase UbiE [Chitinophagales bacterium]MDW8272689.1 bifunctional demethylmenaquinone methyltransferase/2-methoxy-6-polyprenyl-1,4-benzoquinol methylase UbiE [Chitinophagales bacterium]
MKHQVTPYGLKDKSKKEQVEQMFDNIAPRYDFLNHLLSLGIDKKWRKKAVDYINEIKPATVLDVATGTGDFALEVVRTGASTIIGYDLSENMLAYGRQKVSRAGLSNVIRFIKGDSENMPFPDNNFDAVTVGFGVRNFEYLERGLAEIFRVLRPGGRLAILEVSLPRNPLIRMFYNLYFSYVLPLIGRIFSRDVRAYTYLPESVKAFPQGVAFVQILQAAGFVHVKWEPLTFGTCALYTAEKPKT